MARILESRVTLIRDQTWTKSDFKMLISIEYRI